jgi:predicted ATPase
VQDAAHDSLLRSARQQLHGQIAEMLEAQSPELIDNQPELFAQHYTEAGLIEKSVTYWAKAGHRSAALSGMVEAVSQFQKALDQLTLLPDAPKRQRQELELQSGLGAALLLVKGFAAPETGHAYARARELWQQLGSPSEFLHVPWGQFFFHVNRCEFGVAQRLTEDLLSLSRQHNDIAGIVLGHTCSGRALMPIGRFASSRSHLEEALALYASISHRSLLHQVGLDPEVVSQTNLGYVLFFLGFPDQALASIRAAIIGARKLAHPPSLALSLGFGAILLSLIGDDAIFAKRLDELAVVAAEHGFTVYRATGMVLRGWLTAKNGDVANGISLLRDGLTAYRAIGQQAWIPYFICLQAAAYEITGQIEASMALVNEAFQIAVRTGERWFLSELNRQKGQLLLRQQRTETAEELFCKALSIAREQDAKLWELRAAMSLARLRREQGRRTEARDLLAPVYGWFTEGFETADLKEAKALLQELA